MIDLDRIVEQLIQAGPQYNSVEVSRDKFKIILSIALKDQVKEITDIIHKYENQWSKTKVTSLHGIEDNDSSARLIRLLFNLIHDDINNIKDEINLNEQQA